MPLETAKNLAICLRRFKRVPLWVTGYRGEKEKTMFDAIEEV